ncbi:hypothetical protein WJX72_011772 [[Myrmecia] bisecta]|uniref:Kinesin motor domain-containing protein n=1 Tax=[Myrmecia] bisecta TaxID=41462 RepID=A0AAW1QT51_9CHLO
MVGLRQPEWARSTTGLPVECVVRVSDAGGGRQDILIARNRVSLVRPTTLQPRPEDEYDVQYCYGPDSSAKDVLDRTLKLLLRKFVEGHNVTVLVLGSTGSGKSSLLEGRQGMGELDNPKAGSGLVPLAINALFELLHAKALHSADRVATKRRAASAKGYDFLVESTFVEVYDENCRDLFRPGDPTGSRLLVREVPSEGWQVQGLKSRAARVATQLCEGFSEGCAARTGAVTDLGSAQDRAASLYTIRLAQFQPAQTEDEEDSGLVSKLVFVDMPGAERLVMDPEILRLREGVRLNKSLLTFAAALRGLAGDPQASAADFDQSVLTRLLADALGGNSLVTMVGTLRQGEWERSAACLRHLAAAQQVRTYPIVNHARARGLLHKMRARLLRCQEDRQTLRQQLSDVPAEGDRGEVGLHLAKVRDLEARILEEREEAAALKLEKEALAGRLARAGEALKAEAAERSKLQAELIASEEQRLEVSHVLLDFQMEHNHMKEEAETVKYNLEQRILELEAQQMEALVRRDGPRAMTGLDRDGERELQDLREQFAKADADRAELRSEVALQQQSIAENAAAAENARRLMDEAAGRERLVEELQSEVAQMHREADRTQRELALAQIQLQESREAFRARIEHLTLEVADLSQAAGIGARDPSSELAPSLADFRDKVQRLAGQLTEVQAQKDADAQHQLDQLLGRHTKLKRSFKALYAAYRDLRYHLEDLGPKASVEAMHEDQVIGGSFETVAGADDSADRITIAELRERASRLERQLQGRAIETLTGSASPSKMSNYARHSSSKKLLDGSPAPLASIEQQRLKALEQDNRRLQGELGKLRGQALQRRTASLRSLSSAGGANRNSSFRSGNGPRASEGGPDVFVDQRTLRSLEADVQRLRAECEELRRENGRLQRPAGAEARHAGPGLSDALQLENERLRAELDSLRRQQATTPQADLRQQNERLAGRLRELEKVDRSRAQLGFEIAELKEANEKLRRAANGTDSMAGLKRQMKEFTLNTQMDLERQLSAAQARAAAAEEQLSALQQYMAQATVAYQKEIMRLRGLVPPGGEAPRQAAGGGEGALASLEQQQGWAGGVGAAARGQQAGGGGSRRPGSAAFLGVGEAAAQRGRPDGARPVKSASNRQGQIPQPTNANPAVDAWHQ